MIKLIFLSLQIRFILMSNRLIHFFKLTSLYRESAVKIVIIVLGALFVINKKTFLHLMYIAIAVFFGGLASIVAYHGGPLNFFSANNVLSGLTVRGVAEYTLFAWFIMSIIGAPLTSTLIGGLNHANDDMMINYFRADPKTYAKSRILADHVSSAILTFPFLALAFAVLTDRIFTWLVATISSLLLYVAVGLFGEVINMKMYKRFKKHFGDVATWSYFGIPVYIAFIFVPLLVNAPNWAANFANPVVIVLSVLITASSLVYINRYPLYLQLLKDKIHRLQEYTVKQTQKMQNTGTKGIDVSKWSKGIDTQDLKVDKHTHKKGFDYLNAIFFDRHSKFFTKKMFIKCLTLFAPLIAAIVFAVYRTVFAIEVTLWDVEYLSSIFNFTSIILFVVYFASMGRIVTASVFSNCDIQMLHYPYYRRAKTILSSFKSRIIVILRYNLIVSVVLYVSVIGSVAIIAGHMTLSYALWFLFAVFFTSAFFSFNDLFLYYVIQPYDTEGKDKSIPSKVINFVIYIIAYACAFNFRFALVPYTVGIAVATVLYIGIGTILLVRLAPRRFKLR